MIFGKIRPALVFSFIYFLFLSSCYAPPSAIPAAVTSTPVRLTEYPTRTATPLTTATPDVGITLPSATPTQQHHTVQKDELGSEIALRYGVTLAMLQAANPGVDLNYLKEGSDLVIPARQNTPSPILFTPTPISLGVDPAHCYPSVDQKAWCLVNIRNTLDRPVYYLTGEFFVETNGKLINNVVSGLADILPAGAEMPLIVRIDEPVGYPYRIQFELITAFGAENPVVKPLEVSNMQVELDPRGLFARATGTIPAESSDIKQAAVIFLAYQGQIPAGIRRLEIPNGIPAGQMAPFDITVYTTGPLIDRVILLAEGK